MYTSLKKFTVLLALFSVTSGWATDYYFDADGGSDTNTGTSPEQAWATLAKANSTAFQAGDQILLQKGDTFAGKIFLSGDSGASGNPIIMASYGEGERPIINASGYIAGVHIRNAQYIEVRDLEITGDGGAMVDGSPEGKRYGVYLDRTGTGSIKFITIDNLFLHDIYPNVGTDHEGATPQTYVGTGVSMNGGDLAVSNNIVVKNCRIERMGFKAIEMRQVSFVEVLDNDMKDIGGPAIQPGRVNDLIVRGNVVDKSGSFIDPRMHGRGSGIWPWTSERVLIEKNTFMHARGRADSCGIHIDFNCRDVVVQYNLSIDNSGGFLEILGNDYNCAYRYNISINDGARVKGAVDQGTIPNNQDGHIIWLSGFVGSGNTPSGPFNNYIYNNTIFVKSDIPGKFSIAETTDGVLISNNIFYVEGPSSDITSGAFDDYTQEMADRVVWKNNLYQRSGVVPTFNLDLFTDTMQIIGDPLFANVGGLAAADYIPSATALIEDKGILIENIPGDSIGLRIGFEVAEDFFGNPIIGIPDMGAVELGGTPDPIPEAAFSAAPALQGSASAVMTGIEAPNNTEYYFTETSGNFGGNDSGWQLSPEYTDTELLPNTEYSYTVTLRNALDEPGIASAPASLLTSKNSPYENPFILSEDFSSEPDPANALVPFPAETWYVAYEAEAQDFSVYPAGGGLRIGYGYDKTQVLWQSTRTWDLSRDYQFKGDWEITTVLDVSVGFTVALGEFDPSNGQLLQRITQATAGELTSSTLGQTGSFTIDLSAAELLSARVSETSRVGLLLEHEGDFTPSRNDVYVVDNLEVKVLGVESDSDGDGIPDSVEPGLGLNPGNTADGAEDLDLDGQSNFAEFLTGTDLYDPADFLKVGVAMQAGDPQLLLAGASVLGERIYILEHSVTLGAWTAVDAIPGDQADPGQEHVFSYTNPGERDFFRLRVEWE